jgi:L-cysteine/cystine lyase
MTFEEARAAFPVLRRYAYLNAGTLGPLAETTSAAMQRAIVRDTEHGRVGKAYFEGLIALRERLRAMFADLLSVPAQKVALTSSTTDGCNIVLSGLGLGPADEIVTSDREHFGLLGALGASPARVRVAEVAGHPAEAALERILAEVTPRTRLIALQHVSWVTGHVLPVSALKAETGLPILVDGAQSAAAIPVDAGGFDFYTVSAHKWLCGPDGTGALVVADPEGLRVASPSYFGQDGYEPNGDFKPKAGAARFDSGWIPPPMLAGLEAAFEIHPAWRFERAAQTAARCRDLLDGHFDVVTEPGHATLISLRVPGDPAETVAGLHDRGVFVRELPGTGLLRVSCGWWTSDEDLDRLVEGLRDLSRA